MAASPSNTAITSPIVVIGRQYCISEHPIELVIKRKRLTLSMGNFTVTDLDKNIKFKVEASLCSFHDHRILRDPAENPIVTLRNKVLSMHDTCKVFRGESVEEKYLLFTAKTPRHEPMVKNIFLANNTQQKVPDFRFEGCDKSGNYNFYAVDGDSKVILAQMLKKKKNFILTINPNVDCAFIVSLISVLNIALVEDISKLENVSKFVDVIGAIAGGL